jgi:hypothetical protein
VPQAGGVARVGQPPDMPGLRRLPLIAIESPLACDLEAARRVFDAPAALLRLWPGVEHVKASGSDFRLAQRLALPFWGELRHEFVARMHDRPRDRRQRYAIWLTDGWVFDRAVLWKLSSTKDGLKLGFCSQHAVRESRLEQAVNVYRSQTIWPMRHDADAILERLVLSFLYDRLVELDRTYVRQVQDWLHSDPRTSQ